MNFIVVRVDQNYDYVEGVRYIRSFPTEEEANAFIQEKNEEHKSAWRSKMDYIDAWVDALELPQTDRHGWLEYLKQYQIRDSSPQDFKKNLKGASSKISAKN